MIPTPDACHATGDATRDAPEFLCIGGIDEITAGEWNAIVPGDAPMLRHEFLAALEASGCVCPETGWLPRHLIARDRTGLLGAMPFYLKGHSWGEYVFDWAWADAYQRHGLDYYPKAVSAIPFTPTTSARILTAGNTDAGTVRAGIITCSLEVARELQLSSLHSLFLNADECSAWQQQGFAIRHGYQFHWNNRCYNGFDEYLACFTSAKRKKIRQQRKSIARAGIRIERRAGTTLCDEDWHVFYRFYLDTIQRHGALAYLNQDFFTRLGRSMPERILLVQARAAGRVIAAALFLQGDSTLYGRYWGCDRHVSNLHFELCYYQAIEHCITHGLERFEAGAQGEHKLARGLLPVKTYSAHWLRHRQFFRAVSNHIERESMHNADRVEMLQRHSPYKRND